MKAGIMVDALGTSQQSIKLIDQINKLIKTEQSYVDIIVFYHRYDRSPIVPHFAMMQEQEAWGFDGPIIATNLTSAEKLLAFPTPKSKLFYVWDLEWIFNPHIPYKELRNIYQDGDLKLIARNETHATLIEKCWKKPVATLEDFNHEQLIKIFKNAS